MSLQADVGAQRDDGMSPLLCLCSSPKIHTDATDTRQLSKALTCLNFLIAHGCDLRVKDADGRNCLHFASMKAWHEGLQVLLSSLNRTQTASLGQKEGEVLHSLAVDTIDAHGMAPLHYAVQNTQNPNALACATLLFQFGASVNVSKPMFQVLSEDNACNGEWSPLHALCAAAARGTADTTMSLLQLLLEHGRHLSPFLLSRA